MGRGLWKIDSAIITESTCKENMRTQWHNCNDRKEPFLTQQQIGIVYVKGKSDSSNGNKPSAEVNTV
jgi:hypothetical protein